MEVKAFIYAKLDKWRMQGEPKYRYAVDSIEFGADSDYIKVKEVTFEIDAPDEKELDAKTIIALQAKLKKVRADHYVEEQEIETEIANLLAIENKVAA